MILAKTSLRYKHTFRQFTFFLHSNAHILAVGLAAQSPNLLNRSLQIFAEVCFPSGLNDMVQGISCKRAGICAQSCAYIAGERYDLFI